MKTRKVNHKVIKVFDPAEITLTPTVEVRLDSRQGTLLLKVQAPDPDSGPMGIEGRDVAEAARRELGEHYFRQWSGPDPVMMIFMRRGSGP